MLAAALFAAPDVLLLDEPTNHLSIAAVLWLSRELATSPKWASRVMVAVSHDRHFLDDVTTDSLHISGAAHRLVNASFDVQGLSILPNIRTPLDLVRSCTMILPLPGTVLELRAVVATTHARRQRKKPEFEQGVG
jgi:energy-coupling factor transporter ATP-binding protein EcfA2